MAATESTMMALGTHAPWFELFDTISNNMVSIDDVKSEKATVVMFICNHCPYVQHVMRTIVNIAYDYKEKGVSFVAISANDVDNYPMDHPDIMAIVGKNCGFPFPYLYDETQAVAKAYDAACTPDFFVFDGELKLAYRGRLDGSRPKSEIVCDGNELKAALDALIEDAHVSTEQFPSIGCNIKWKK
ncbi:MAG: thioredoxin family protein [Deltaproteobacteria bacterium]